MGMATATVTGLESALRTVLRGIFGVHPTKIDPALYGEQTDAPNPIEYDAETYREAMTDTDMEPAEVSLTFTDPVSVLQKGSTAWGGRCEALNAVPTRIVNANPNRKRLVITNIGNYTTGFAGIAIGPDAGVSFRGGGNGSFIMFNAGYGFAGSAPATSSIELTTIGDVWAITDGGSAYVINILEEFYEGGGRVN